MIKTDKIETNNKLEKFGLSFSRCANPNVQSSLLHRCSLGSSGNPMGEEDCVTSPKSVCVGGYVQSSSFYVISYVIRFVED